WSETPGRRSRKKPSRVGASTGPSASSMASAARSSSGGGVATAGDVSFSAMGAVHPVGALRRLLPLEQQGAGLLAGVLVGHLLGPDVQQVEELVLPAGGVLVEIGAGDGGTAGAVLHQQAVQDVPFRLRLLQTDGVALFRPCEAQLRALAD